jgi:hypothetical protein
MRFWSRSLMGVMASRRRCSVRTESVRTERAPFKLSRYAGPVLPGGDCPPFAAPGWSRRLVADPRDQLVLSIDPFEGDTEPAAPGGSDPDCIEVRMEASAMTPALCGYASQGPFGVTFEVA